MSQLANANVVERNQVDTHYEQQRERYVDEHRDDDSCLKLWLTVIERAVSDMQYLQKLDGRTELKKHEKEKLRRIHENPPTEFFNSEWFEEICTYLQVEPDKLRRNVDELLSRKAA